MIRAQIKRTSGRIRIKKRHTLDPALAAEVERDIDERMELIPERYRAPEYEDEHTAEPTEEEEAFGGIRVRAKPKKTSAERFGSKLRGPGKRSPSSPLYDANRVPKQIYRMRMLGLSDQRIADVLMVDRKTLYNWRLRYPAVTAAWNDGGIEADALVTNALFRRAVGYEHPAEKISIDARSGDVVRADYVERFAPDTTAAIFWLTNRQAEQWKQKRTSEHTGPGGAALTPAVINVFPVVSKNASAPTIDYDAIDQADEDEEQRVRLLGHEIVEDFDDAGTS